MDKDDLTYIIKCARNGNEAPFNSFFDRVFKKIRTGLSSITGSQEDAKEVFLISMQKFWERFVINQEELPLNSTGYIFMMCKNAWLMQKRGLWGSVVYSEEQGRKANNLIENDVFDYQEDKDNIDSDHYTKHKALALALDELSPKCKTLIENELNPNIQLKDLQNELGYSNYQALVQAKYNCKKRLIKKVYEVLEKLKTVI